MVWREWFWEMAVRRDVYGNTAHRWLTAVAIALAVALALRILKAVIAGRLRRVVGDASVTWPAAVLGLLERTRTWFFIGMALYCGSLALTFPPNVKAVIESVAVMVLLLQGAIWGNAAVNFAVRSYSQGRLAVDAARATTVSLLGFLAKVALWTLVVLLALDNVGVNITALVAGLGIGGIAVALAAQNILGDLFASLSIMLDRPFVLGDFVKVGDFAGTVEHIGIKTTRLRSLSGEQLVFSNNDLLQSRIRNFKRMAERRVVFTLGVSYQTPVDKLAALPGSLRQMVEAQSLVRFDRGHFQTFGDSALVFEVVYYVLSPDYNLFMDIQQSINLAIVRQLGQEQIEIAYPTRTIFLVEEGGPRAAGK